MKTKLIDLLGLTNMANDIRDWVNAHFQRKVDGKGLSTNDYDGTAKAKVDAIPADPKYTDTVYDDTALSGKVSTIEGKESGWDAKQDALVSGTNIKTVNGESLLGGGNIEIQGGGGGEENVIEAITMNGASVPVTNKTAAITETDPTVPSWAKQPNKPSYNYSEIGNTPDLSGFITKSVNDLTNYYLKSETYTKAEVAALIGAIQNFHYEFYASTSAVTNPQGNVLYLIGPTGTGSDKYEEYVYSNNDWHKIGDTSIDLSGYVTTSALNTALAGYVSSSDLATALSAYTPTSNLATVATSGDYDDLTNKPTIPTVPVQDVTVGGTSVVSNGTAVIPQEVFVATYGTTTATEIEAAITANKAIICIYNGNGYVYGRSNSSYYYLDRAGENLNYYVRLTKSNNTWFAGSRTLESVADKVSTISGNETNTIKYPNTKAVYDYVDSICGNIQTILTTI